MNKPKRAKLTLKPKPAPAAPTAAPKPVHTDTPPTTTADEARRWLASTYPTLFVTPLPLPFAVGVGKQIIASVPATMSKKPVRRAMQAWCNRQAYYKAILNGADRYGLDGKPAGEITEKDREHAKKRLTVPKNIKD
jgi:sRNA-binding protein